MNSKASKTKRFGGIVGNICISVFLQMSLYFEHVDCSFRWWSCCVILTNT